MGLKRVKQVITESGRCWEVAEESVRNLHEALSEMDVTGKFVPPTVKYPVEIIMDSDANYPAEEYQKPESEYIGWNQKAETRDEESDKEALTKVLKRIKEENKNTTEGHIAKIRAEIERVESQIANAPDEATKEKLTTYAAGMHKAISILQGS